MLNDKLFPSNFNSDNIPTWPCPECGYPLLSCSDNQFQKQYKTPIDTKNPAFEVDWIEYIFTMHLECANPLCGCRVVCIGTGDVSQEYLEDGSGDSGWSDTFHVKFFEPALRIFVPPIDTPYLVKKSLETSFSIFFSSPSTSLSALRSSLEVLLEVLLGKKGVASADDNRKFSNLAKRIKLLPKDYQKIVAPANAIRWMGNEGTHPGGGQVRKNDVLNGYRIFEHILNTLYPEKIASVEALVARTNKVRGLGR